LAEIPFVSIAGLQVARLDSAAVTAHVADELAAGRGGWLVTANVDFVQRASTDPAARALYAEADLIVADGAPLVWASRLRGEPLPERVAGADLVWTLAEAAAEGGHGLYLLGGDGEAAEVAAVRMVERIPGLRVAGHSSPRVSSPPTAEELAPIRQALQASGANLVYVALGSPKQEHLIRALRSEFPAVWWLGCGISLSFMAGYVERAPLWMQRVGLEWSHRLFQEPGRLASRYLTRNLPFTVRLLWEAGRAGR
jgi:N-acetylglucosaminyldiphosphoundecaprenol N-acetyl-beta-D-mannosaminyltransferase